VDHFLHIRCEELLVDLILLHELLRGCESLFLQLHRAVDDSESQVFWSLSTEFVLDQTHLHKEVPQASYTFGQIVLFCLYVKYG
jgi:hypothetical protein